MALLLSCPKCNTSRLSIPPAPKISPISPLLLNNDPPESHEEGCARQIISTSITALQEIEAILAEVNQIVEALKHRKQEYQEQIQLHQTVFAKSRQIPSDVLSEFFQQTVADQGEKTRWCEEVWTVAGVCRRWRAAALSSPQIWAVLPAFSDQLRKGHRNHYRLQKALERSGSFPLRLIIHGFAFNLQDDSPFLSTFLPHFHRVAHLTLVNPHEAFPLLPNVQAFPSLKSIAFTNIRRSALESQHIAQMAPLLQELKISPPGSPSWTLTDLHRVSVSWSQLRKVSVNKIDFNGAKSLLQAATSLEECILYLSGGHGSTPLTSFSSKHLGRLCIDATSVDVVENFFEHAKIPTLRKLVIGSTAVGMRCLSEFILRSSCTLTLLEGGLSFSEVMQDNLLIFSLLDEVTDLGLDVGRGFRIHSLLKTDPLHPSLLPKLRHLYIRTNDQTNLTQLIDGVGPSTFRNTNSPAVLSGTVAAIDTIILREYRLRESTRDNIFFLLDRRPEGNIDHDRVLLWSKQLRQVSTTHREGAPRIADHAADLGRITSEMETHGKIHAHLLIDTDIIDNLRHVLEQLGDNADLKPLRQRLSAVLGEWKVSVHAYLNSVGWMKCAVATLVYGRRRGSLVTKFVEKRFENRFVSFAVVDGAVIL